MKFDMSGGAAVLGALQAIAALELPVRVLAVVGATENTISGSAMKPGDIVRAMTGTTIEVNNTDAEGRLVLCDCLAYAVAQGAERIVDIATLTGGIVTALGVDLRGPLRHRRGPRRGGHRRRRRGGRARVAHAAARRLRRADQGPLRRHRRTPTSRKAHPIQGASFLKRFVGDVPWAHLDIAGTGHDNGRAYAAKGGAGWGVRLLVELARAQELTGRSYRPSGWRATKPAVLRPVVCQRVPEPRMPPVSKRRPATSMKTWPPLA